MVLGMKLKDLLMPVLPKMDQPKEVFSAKRMYQTPPTKPVLSAPAPPVHAPTLQFKYLPPIKSKVNASSVINRVLSEKVCLLVEELLALAPEVRRHFK